MHGPTCIFWANLTPFSLEGMRNLTGYLRTLGFRFGIYTAAGVNACDGAHGTSSPGR